MSKKNPSSVSIAMATYNGAEHIRDQLDDLAAQTHLPSELVICDDGSSDKTLEIVREFAATAPFAVHVHANPERLGYRANFIKCASLCGSELIAFCDQDDRWDHRKLELVAAPFVDHEVLLTYHNARVITERGRTLGLVYPITRKAWKSPALSLQPWSFPMGFTQIFRRSLLAFDDLWQVPRDHDEEGQPLAHDRWYYFLAGVLGSVAFVPDLLANYRQHETNTYGLSWFRARLPGLTELWHSTYKRKLRLTAAQTRANLLRQLGERVDGKWKQRAINAAELYEKLAQLAIARDRIYDEGRLFERGTAFVRLVRAGGYGAKPPRYSRLNLAMDATVGVAGLFPMIEGITRSLVRR